MRALSLLVLTASVAVLAFAPSAWAEEGEQGNDIRQKIKAQMEKILELMKANQDALTELSTGGAATTRDVDVKVPPSEGSTDGQPSSSSSSSGSEAGTTGQEAAEEIERLLGTQKSQSRKIPTEIEELIKMIPT